MAFGSDEPWSLLDCYNEQNLMIDYILSHKVGLLEYLSKFLRKNKGKNLDRAANLLTIICLTVGQNPETDNIFGELISMLMNHLEDKSNSYEIRRKCAKSVGICSFVVGTTGLMEQVMDRLYNVFRDSMAKGDGTMPILPEPLCLLHAACIQSWTLILTSVHDACSRIANDVVENTMDKIIELLDHPSLDVKMAAGDTLAIMFEFIRLENQQITADDFPDLCERLEELATETQKSKGKKDMRLQRANFREIFASINNEKHTNLTIKFGNEKITLKTWAQKKQYQAFVDLLGTLLNKHLTENEVLRKIFDLGPPILEENMPQIRRSDNHYENMLADKQRTKCLRKLRDKRVDMLD